jgi:hypothetical protein
VIGFRVSVYGKKNITPYRQLLSVKIFVIDCCSPHCVHSGRWAPAFGQNDDSVSETDVQYLCERIGDRHRSGRNDFEADLVATSFAGSTQSDVIHTSVLVGCGISVFQPERN